MNTQEKPASRFGLGGCLAIFIAAIAATSCTEDPARVGRPPVVREFTPPQQDLDAFSGDTLAFAVDAFDPDGAPLRRRFSIGDSIVSRADSWSYVVEGTGEVTIRCVVSDDEYESQIRWTVMRHPPVNHRPHIESYSPLERELAMMEGSEQWFNIEADDPDGDSLSYFFTVNGAPAGTGPRFLYSGGAPGSYTVRGWATDGELYAGREWSLTVEALPVNHPPYIVYFEPADTLPTINVDEELIFLVVANDQDEDDLTYLYTVDGAPVWNGNRLVFGGVDVGSYVVEAWVSDGEFSVGQRWNLTVYGDNRPPVIVSYSPTNTNPELQIGTDLEFSVQAEDPDGDPLVYRFALDEHWVATGQHYVFTATAAGRYVVEAFVVDGGHYTKQRWDVTVLEGNRPPVITSYSPSDVTPEMYAGTDLEFSIVATDHDDDPLTYAFTVDGATVASADRFVFTATQEGQYVVVASVSDGEFISSQTWDLTVHPPWGGQFAGLIRDAVTLGPIAGVHVQLGPFHTTTDATGHFALTELPISEGVLSVRDETMSDDFGEYFDYSVYYHIGPERFLDLLLLPNCLLTTAFYTDFQQFYRAMTDKNGIPPATAQRRWALPIDLCVPAFSSGGLDYQATIVGVASDFDAILGTAVFNIVASVPAPGVQVKYRPNLYSDNYEVTEWTPDYYPLQAEIEFRTHYGAASAEAFKVIIRHELGHALGLNHSIDPNHLMVGGQAPRAPWFTADEIDLIKAYHHIPRGHEMSNHRRD